MTVKLYAFTCGTLAGEFVHLMEGGEGDVTVPIPVFLIEHPRGRALFDTRLTSTTGVPQPNSTGSRAKSQAPL
jgi:N-acyl homoserine lactone hydrolase